MKHLILFVVSVILASSLHVSSAEYWTDCGTKAFMVVSKFTVDPSPPKIGKNATISIAGNLARNVTGGTAALNAQVYLNGWHDLPEMDADICDLAACPVQAGVFTNVGSFPIPTYAIVGEYKGNLVVTDLNNATVFCVNYDINLEH